MCRRRPPEGLQGQPEGVSGEARAPHAHGHALGATLPADLAAPVPSRRRPGSGGRDPPRGRGGRYRIYP